MIRFAVAAIGGLLLGAGAQAAATIDQSYLIDGSGSYSTLGIGNTPTGQFDAMQTATAGLTGKLTGLSLQLFDDTQAGTVQISIIGNVAIDPLTKAVSGDQSAAISVLSNILPTTAEFRAGGLLTLDTSNLGVYLTSGEAFGILVRFVQPPQTFGIAWAQTFQGGSTGYAGGNAAFVENGIAHDDDTDVGFRTYVDPSLLPPPSTVPEPASWAMMAGGFGLLGGALRRRGRPESALLK